MVRFRGETLFVVILISPRLLWALPQLDAVRLNADFFDQASDHDPLVLRLSFALGRHEED